MIRYRDVFLESWKLFSKNWWRLILLCIFCKCWNPLLSSLTASLGIPAWAQNVVFYTSSVLVFLLSLGFFRYLMALQWKKREPRLIFLSFQNRRFFIKAVVIWVIISLPGLLLLLMQYAAGWMGLQEAPPLFSLLTSYAIVFLQIQIFLLPYLFLYKPDWGIWKLLRETLRKIRGRLWRTFGLFLIAGLATSFISIVLPMFLVLSGNGETLDAHLREGTYLKLNMVWTLLISSFTDPLVLIYAQRILFQASQTGTAEPEQSYS